ncbi:hypothetical protein B0H17DRAFT_1197650 [Mycena rosella]|uniref:C2H2-type domain-containing protein n=1 Tax=Mycena rosella TaxID=1033263 RepID=A0AAD7DRD6_MYCRO|nr:hypothetical protein B0H17DRAFT_1197650 [Mycena rosella]
MDPACKYCGASVRTTQGIRSHLAQSRACRQQHFEEFVAHSDSDTDSDSSQTDAEPDSASLPDETGATGHSVQEDEFQLSDGKDTYQEFDPPQPASPERATMEEVEDEDDGWFQSFPPEKAAGAILEKCKTQFERLCEEQKKGGHAPWAPFESQEEWELARWLITSGLSQTKTDKFLKLKTVHEGINPAFHNNRAFLQRIDTLPEGPKWECHPFKLMGDELDADAKPKIEVLEMWCRDPVECVKELLGNPAFTAQCYEPYRVFKNADHTNREYNEMWTGNWWWTIQELLPKGSTLAPIILASDKTQLTRFSGDKQAWPVYLIVGNIDKQTRRAPSSRATILIGYIPVSKFEIFSKKQRSGVSHQFFHDCMSSMLKSLKAAGSAGMEMDCACLVCCCMENSCPGCSCGPKERGDTSDAPVRDPVETLAALSMQSRGEYPTEFVDQNLRPINPFWADFPHCNIFACITPDLLHELHNGAFGDHMVKWATEATGGQADEIDQRFRAMTPHPTLRHFKKGISMTSQWTGTERKNMEKVFLGVLVHATDPAVQLAVRRMLDFVYYAHFETHCDESLAQQDAAWSAFHASKDIFIKLGICKHFNINKIHKLKHYIDSIRSRGTADGFNTEGSEHLHIDLAKASYNASNKRGYTRQMTVWLRWQEAIYKFGTYLQWAVPGYSAPVESRDDTEAEEEKEEKLDLAEEQEEAQLDPSSAVDVPEDSDDEDDEVEEMPRSQPSLPSFTLAKKPGFPTLTAETIAADFHAPDLLDKIASFLESKYIVPRLEPATNTIFPVYKRVSISLPLIPEVGSRDVYNKIRAVKGEPSKLTAKGHNLGVMGTPLLMGFLLHGSV